MYVYIYVVFVVLYYPNSHPSTSYSETTPVKPLIGRMVGGPLAEVSLCSE
jgi:hypothetical protein